MPTYEYRCRDCGHSFDIVQKMSDDPLTHCPECGGHLRKVFAPPAISFKGSGFYATDHREKAKSSTDAKGTDTKEGAETKKDSTKESTASPGSTGDAKKGDSKTSKAAKKEGSS